MFLHFFSSLPSLLKGLKGKRGRSAFEFSLRFSSYRSTCQQPIGTRFLHAIRQEKQRTLWSGVPRSIVADIRPFLLLFLMVSCPVSFLVFAADTIYSRTIEFLLSTWTITRVSGNNLSPFATFSRENSSLEDWIAIIAKWGIFLCFLTW